MFVTLKIIGYPVLVENDASRKYRGPEGIKIVKNLGLRVEKSHGLVQMANGQVELVSQNALPL